MTTHELKIWPRYFNPILTGEKTFELREAKDRVFHAGDELHLREWIEGRGYTGRELRVTVTYLLVAEFGLKPGWVCMSFCTRSEGKVA